MNKLEKRHAIIDIMGSFQEEAGEPKNSHI